MNIDHVDNIKAKSGGNRNLEQSVLHFLTNLNENYNTHTYQRSTIEIYTCTREKI